MSGLLSQCRQMVLRIREAMIRLATTPIGILLGLRRPPKLKLSPKWAPMLERTPETGMGYWVVTIVLKDGRRYHQAVIDRGFVTWIRGYGGIPFKEDDIEEIIVTHDKLDWWGERW